MTHKKVFANLDFIKSKGIDLFIDNQKIKLGILTEFLTNFDDGPSKSFFCVSCALLPLDKLQESHDIVNDYKDSTDIKIKNKRLRELLSKTAYTLAVGLKLNTKK